MRLVQWKQTQDPWSELFDGASPFNKSILCDAGECSSGARGWYPAVDISKNEEYINIKADLPGVKKEDIKLSVENNVLTIEGERKTEEEKKEKSFYRVERSYGLFRRSIHLGENVDPNKIKAQYKDGVLDLTIPKAENAKPKSIIIEG